ncbi:MAG: 4-hydroxybenzoyl-CoA reductase subunit beta [Rhodobacteraceae bacterium]|nr:4-hydroxybenzoyl-CoA reductase subunit beta [Paracoccaceae bacterium]
MSEVMPDFQLARPTTLDEAVVALATPEARIIAGGTDLNVQLRMGLAAPATLVDLSLISALKTLESSTSGTRIGAGVTLADLASDERVAAYYPAITEAAALVAGPTHREVATLGGNLCLDTRCLYYNQSHWWRKSNDYCLKYQGDICHVAPKGNRCRAAYSGDLAPALMVHDARLEIIGPDGIRQVMLADFYREDGADYIDLKPGEMVTAAVLPPPKGPSGYRKIRVRGAVDFPLAGVAVEAEETKDGKRFTIALTGTNSCPIMVDMPDVLTDDPNAFFANLNKAVQKAVSPQRTTTIAPHYRRLSIAAMAARLARELV